MQLKNFTEEEIEELAGLMDNEGFWYSLTDGGYLTPNKLLDNADDIKKVEEAIKILVELQELVDEIVEY